LGIAVDAYARPWTAILPDDANLPVFFHRSDSSTLASVKTSQQLSREAIDEFKAIYQDEFGVHLSDDQVQEIALRLLRFFGILARPEDTSK